MTIIDKVKQNLEKINKAKHYLKSKVFLRNLKINKIKKVKLEKL